MAAANNSPKIVVSYRRADSAMSGRIFDRLVERFGQNSLFIDIDNIPFGGDFRKHIADALTSSDLLIAVIGRDWIGQRDNGPSRIMNATDPVRVEIETAIKSNVPILPVLIDGAMMPDPEQLPDSIKEFSFLNALEVELGRDFKVHIQRLFGAVAQILGSKLPPGAEKPTGMRPELIPQAPAAAKGRNRSLLPILLGGSLVVALLGGGLLVWLGRDHSATTVPSVPAAAVFCDALKSIIAEGPTKFVSLLGPEHSDVWTARTQLPGWENCTVQDWTYQGVTKRYYQCDQPSTDASDLDQKLAVAEASVTPCLGPDWIVRRTRFSDMTYDVTFERRQEDPVVRLRQSHYKDPEEWLLKLAVEVPGSS